MLAWTLGASAGVVAAGELVLEGTVTATTAPVTALTPGATGRSLWPYGIGARVGCTVGVTIAVGADVGVAVGVGVGVDPPPGDCGMTGADAGLAAEVPIRLVAVEVNVYDVPLLSPVIVHEPLEPVIGQVSEPGVDVTTHDAAGPPTCG